MSSENDAFVSTPNTKLVNNLLHVCVKFDLFK